MIIKDYKHNITLHSTLFIILLSMSLGASSIMDRDVSKQLNLLAASQC